MTSGRSFIPWLGAAIRFAVFYGKEVVLSNLRVGYDVLTPRDYMRPAILELDVSGMSDRQLLAAANLITMTPGTLGLDIDENRGRMTVHAMYVDDPQAEVHKLESEYLRRIRDVF